MRNRYRRSKKIVPMKRAVLEFELAIAVQDITVSQQHSAGGNMSSDDIGHIRKGTIVRVYSKNSTEAIISRNRPDADRACVERKYLNADVKKKIRQKQAARKDRERTSF